MQVRHMSTMVNVETDVVSYQLVQSHLPDRNFGCEIGGYQVEYAMRDKDLHIRIEA